MLLRTTASPCSARLHVTLLKLLAVHLLIAGLVTAHEFRLPSGRVVDLSSVGVRFRTIEHARRSLYELTPDNLLRSHHHTIDLSSAIATDNVQPSSSLKFRLDGNDAPLTTTSESSVRIKYGTAYVAFEYSQHTHSHDNGTYQLVHVFSNTVSLSAVSGRGGRHLFVASHYTPTSMQQAWPSITSSLLSKVQQHSGPSSKVRHNSRQASGSCASGTEHYIEIGIAYDHTLCRFYNYDARKTLMMIEAMFMAASRPFILDTCVRLALVHVDGYCREATDPYKNYKNFESFDILPSFIQEWQQPKYDSVQRDVMYLLTGVNDGGTVASGSVPGFARGVCDTMWSYGWAEGINPNVFARSLGQSLGATSSAEGLMQRVYTPGTVVDTFADESVTEISTFIDSNPFASCITAQKPGDTVFPIVMAAPSPTALPPYGSCSVSRRAANVLQCTPGERVIGRVSSGRAGTLHVTSFQEFGTFVSIVRAVGDGVRIDRFKGVQSTNGSVDPFLLEFFDDDEGRVDGVRTEVRSSIAASVLRWPRPFLTCCDHRLYVYVRVVWCKGAGSSGGARTEVCDEKLEKFSRKIQCVSPCFGRSGHVVPMSSTNRCPSCA